MSDKSSLYVLVEGMYFLTKVTHRISTFLAFHCLPEVVQILHVIFETRSQSEFLLIPKENKKSRQVLHRIFLKLQYKMYRGASILYFNVPFF